MKNLSNVIALSLLLVGNAVMAQEVSVEAAKSRVLEFLSNKTSGPMRAKGQQVSNDLELAYTSKSEAKTCFYVFNVGNDEGFVIAGGDESACEILGYCDHGTFDYDKANPTFKWWLSQYTEQIEHADASAVTKAPRRAKAATEERESIGPLIKTKWGQEYPYNSEIPIYDPSGKPYVTGCVATAMAQVMYYHKCPATNGTGNYTSNYAVLYNDYEYGFSADFENTTYDWEHMLLDYSYGYSDEYAKAVGTLMYHVGVSVDMAYNTNESGADYFVGSALIKHFKYDKSIRYESRAFFNDEDWAELLYSELSAQRPILYCGGAHAFICDGYDNLKEMFSFNWGWNGSEDGCYALTGTDALNKYNQGQIILTGVQPECGGEVSPHLVLDGIVIWPEEENEYGLTLCVEGSEVYHYDYHTSKGSISNCYLLPILCDASCLDSYYYFNLGIKATETTNGNTYYWYCKSGDFNGPNGSSGSRFYIDPYDLKYNGTYEIRPVYRISGYKEWMDVEIAPFFIIPTITISGAKDPELIDVEFSLESNTLQVCRTMQVELNSNYTGTITYSSSDPDIATVDENGLITGVSEGNVTITVHTDANYYFNETTKEFEITVTKLVKDDVFFKIPNISTKVGGSIQIKWTKTYDGTPVFTSSNNQVATVDENGLIQGIGLGKAVITASAPATTIFNEGEAEYTICVAAYGTSPFVEQPYFNNDNNAYEDDLILHFKVLNLMGDMEYLPIYYSLTDDNGQLNIGNFTTYPASYQKETIINIDFRSMYYVEEDLANYLSAGNTYTLSFYNEEECLTPYDYYPSVTFTYRDKLELDYGVSPADYGTLILPFNAELPEGMTIYSCPSVDENGVLTLVEESSIERNKPYIVKATYGTNYHFEGPEAIDADKPSFQEGILVGAVANNVPLQKNTDYILQVQDGKTAFYKYTGKKADEPSENDAYGNRLAKQFRAFLRLPEGSNNAPKFNLPGFDEDETESISTLRSDGTMPAGIYSIDGKRQSEFQKGLNILLFEDGTAQKVFVK